MKNFYLNLKRNALVSGLIVLFLSIGLRAHAVDYTVLVDQNWSDFNPLPNSTDNIIVRNNAVLTIDVSDAVCNSMALAVTSNKEGNLIFNNGSQLTISGNISFEAGGNGPHSLDMSSGGTLICQGITLNTTDVTFTPGTGTIVLTATNTLPTSVFTTFNNLTISNGTTTFPADVAIGSNLTIASTAAATISSGFTLSGAGDLLIESTAADASGSLIVDGTFSMTGTKTVQRWIPDDDAQGYDGDDWHIISSPVGGIDLYTWAGSNEVNPGTGDYDLAPYDEQVDANTYGDWNPYISSTGTNFQFGYGYAMRRILSPTNDFITFSGSSIQTTDLTGVAITADANGWNALGNPFLSAIDIGTFLTVNAAQLFATPYNVAYLWDPTTSDYSGTGIGTVALGQGFLVKSKGGGGSVQFTTAMQSTGTATFKSGEIPLPTVLLTAASGNLLNKTKLIFSEEATLGLDKLEIGKFKGNPDIALYTRMPNDAAYDLQDQAIPAYGEESYRIPVGLDLPGGGEVTFTASKMAFTEWAEIYIEDTSNDKLTLLNGDDMSYTADVAEGTNGTGRFYLVINKSATVDAQMSELNEDFSVYTRNREIVINGPADADTRFQLYSLEGRCWYTNKAVNTNVNYIDGSAFPAGVYVLKISKTGAVQTEKLLLSGN